MVSRKFIAKLALLAVAAGVTSAYAQGKPGVDRPIRVGQFKGTGTGGSYWHDNIHQSSILLNTILTAPTTSNLGDDLVLPTHNPPFTFATFGVVTTGEKAPATGKTPTVAETNAFIAALDTLDVAIISCMVNFETIFTTAAQRQALLSFSRRKGYFAVHATTDTDAGWTQGDSLHGTAFRGHPTGDRMGTVRVDSVFQADTSWKFLNRGLFSGGTLDTAFTEEWFFFTTSGSSIRSQANLKPTIKLMEASLANGFAPQTAMGDHPHAWYRTSPDSGGRSFYTAVGHRPNLWNTNTGAPRFFRRQLYNSILWLAKYDSSAVVSVNYKTSKAPGGAFNYAKLSVKPSELSVTVTQNGMHAVELVSMNGQRIGSRRGNGEGKSYTFGSLNPGVYSVLVYTPQGRSDRLVTIY
jgi:hypothetical protein